MFPNFVTPIESHFSIPLSLSEKSLYHNKLSVQFESFGQLQAYMYPLKQNKNSLHLKVKKFEAIDQPKLKKSHDAVFFLFLEKF